MWFKKLLTALSVKNRAKFAQFDRFKLLTDLNPEIRAGMIGVILEVYDKNHFEVEFVKADGTNYEVEGSPTFALNESVMAKLDDVQDNRTIIK